MVDAIAAFNMEKQTQGRQAVQAIRDNVCLEVRGAMEAEATLPAIRVKALVLQVVGIEVAPGSGRTEETRSYALH